MVEFIFRLEKRLELFWSTFLNLNAAKNRVGLSWRLEKFLSYFLISFVICHSVARRWMRRRYYTEAVIFVANTTFSILPSPNRLPLAWAVRWAATASHRRNHTKNLHSLIPLYYWISSGVNWWYMISHSFCVLSVQMIISCFIFKCIVFVLYAFVFVYQTNTAIRWQADGQNR